MAGVALIAVDWGTSSFRAWQMSAEGEALDEIVANAGGGFVNMSPHGRHAVWWQYGETRQLGYLKVTVDPESNTATAQEIYVAYVETNDAEEATVYDPPIVADTVTFPLSKKVRTLTVSKSGLGSGTIVSSPPYIDCGSTCRANFKGVTEVVFTPVPEKESWYNKSGQ